MIWNGKRLAGYEVVKLRGSKEWSIVETQGPGGWGPCVQLDTDDPREERFHYCSIVAQPVFYDYFSQYDRAIFTPSSYKKLPEAWRVWYQPLIDDLFKDKEEIPHE